MKTSVITTADGSHTLFSESFHEIYHSRHGAIAESEHVFIKNGLELLKGDSLRVFEVGYGTGLNAFLSLVWARRHRRIVYYETIECYPVEKDVFEQMNYTVKVENGEFKDEYLHLNLLEWNKVHGVNDYFIFNKIQSSILEFEPENNSFDVIFFDAFAPTKQPELWSESVFQKMFSALKPGGHLTTYCAKGDVRRAMKAVGFKVEKRPGPPFKREMLVAIKTV